MGILPNDIERRIREEIHARDLELLELKQRGERGSTVLEVVIDAERDVTLDDLSQLNRWIGDLLDEVEDELPSRYRLEVSSGGIGRPIEFDWQLRKNMGRLVKVTWRDEAETVQAEIFRLQSAGEESVTLASKAKKPKPSDVPLELKRERILKMIVEPEF